MIKWIWSGLTIVGFLMVVLWFLSVDESVIEKTSKPANFAPVSVLKVHPSETRVTYDTTGITMPRWLTNVITAVDGRVKRLPDHIEPGSLLAEGDTLVQLMDTFYRAELENTKANLATAELELARTEREQTVLKQNARDSFGRREPHVRAAKANLSAAKTAYENADQRLQDTIATSPFPAVVISRQVSPGQWVTAGDLLFSLAASDSIDVKVELGDLAWARLGNPSVELIPTITAPAGTQWQASLRYLSPVMDPVTRQRSLFLKVENPYQSNPPLLPDQQVKVSFEGPILSHVIIAPATVLTGDGKVWTVHDNHLLLENIELLDEQQDKVRFRFKQAPGRERLLVSYPLSVMLEGQQVSPVFLTDQSVK